MITLDLDSHSVLFAPVIIICNGDTTEMNSALVEICIFHFVFYNQWKY